MRRVVEVQAGEEADNSVESLLEQLRLERQRTRQAVELAQLFRKKLEDQRTLDSAEDLDPPKQRLKVEPERPQAPLFSWRPLVVLVFCVLLCVAIALVVVLTYQVSAEFIGTKSRRIHIY